MKRARLIHILLVCLFFFCSCSREDSVVSGYRSLAKELEVNSSSYTEEDWTDVAKKYEKLEKSVENCKFSATEKKELNKLRGQCAAYMLKGITTQAKNQLEYALEQFSDMAEGFSEALGEDGLDGLFNDEDE